METLTDGQNTFEYEEEQYHQVEDYLNRDFEFLIIQLLREAYSAGKDAVTMGSLTKMNYWDIDYIREEITDTNDHWSIESMVLETFFFVIEDLRLGRINNVTLAHYSDAIERVAENAVRSGFDLQTSKEESRFEIRELTMRYNAMINNLTLLRATYNKQQDEMFAATNSTTDWQEARQKAERIEESRTSVVRSPLMDLLVEIPDLVEISFTLNSEKMRELDQKIGRFLVEFSVNTQLENVPKYQEKRLDFAKQIENFCAYLGTLNLIGDTINIPFSVLRDESFEAVKILSFLKNQGRIDFDWTRNDYWSVSFASAPITPQSLLGLIDDSEKNLALNNEIKYNLSFSPQPCHLTFTSPDGQETKISIQGQVQKEVLRVIFKDPNRVFDDWSLYDISEILGSEDVSTRAVANAIYQFNLKVQRSLPHVKHLFDHNYSSARLNSKYVQRS